MSQDTQEVAKINPAQYPAFIGSLALGKGHEDVIETSDLILPRAKLVQFTSEEVTAENPEDRIEPGKLINSITKQELTPLIIPIYRYKTYTFFNPLDRKSSNYDPAYEAGEMVFSTTDKNDPRIGDGLEFKDGEAPRVTEAFNYLSLFPGERLPLILSFKRTSLRAAKELNTMLQLSGGDMFSNRYKIVITRHEDGQRKWFSISVRGAGKATAEEHAIANQIFEHFRGQGKVADVVEQHAAPEQEADPAKGW